MKHLKNEKGFALLTVFLLGTISMILVGIVFYLLTVSSSMSGMDKRYISELDAAKGIGEYIMTELRRDDLTCSGSCTNANATITVPIGICTAIGKTDCSTITATVLSSDTYTPSTAGADPITFTAVRVESQHETTDQRAIIEFVYKTY